MGLGKKHAAHLQQGPCKGQRSDREQLIMRSCRDCYRALWDHLLRALASLPAASSHWSDTQLMLICRLNLLVLVQAHTSDG